MKVHLCIPCKDSITAATTRWVSTSLTTSGVITDYSDLTECCWVDVARAELLGKFFQGTCDYLLYLDRDISSPIPGGDLVRDMMKVDLPVVAMTYLKRDPIGKNPPTLCVEYKKGEKSFERNGVRALGIESTGLGFTLIHREVLASMARNYVDLRQKSLNSGDIISNLFLPEIVGGEYYGDDRNFFRRVRKVNYGVYTLLDRTMIHEGMASTLTGS